MPHHDEFAYNPGDIAQDKAESNSNAILALRKRLNELETRISDLEDTLQIRQRFEQVTGHGPTTPQEFQAAQDRARRETLDQ